MVWSMSHGCVNLDKSYMRFLTSFENPLLRWILDGLSMLALHMPRDVKEATSRLIHATVPSKSSMITNYQYYREIFARLKRPVFSIAHNVGYQTSTPSLEAYMSYGLGSGANGDIVSEVPCSNASNRGSGGDTCSNVGLLPCTQVR
jgi:hypothetical protein